MAIALLHLLAGAGALWFSRRVSTAVRRSSGWPTVLGVALERGTEGPPEKRSQCQPYVRYSYEVGDRTYSNDQFLLFGLVYCRMSSTAQRAVDSVPDPVPVHYNPADPAESYLVVNSAWHRWVPGVFGAGALVLGLMELVVALSGPP